MECEAAEEWHFESKCHKRMRSVDHTRFNLRRIQRERKAQETFPDSYLVGILLNTKNYVAPGC